jgi:hypothetical protein
MTSHPSDRPVSALQARMIADVSMHVFSAKARNDYIRDVLAFVAFLGRSPDTSQFFKLAEECQPVRRMRVGEPRHEEPPEHAEQHAHWKKAAGSAVYPAPTVERYPAARHDHVDVPLPTGFHRIRHYGLLASAPARRTPRAPKNSSLRLSAAETLLTIAAGPPHLGARIDATAVLHTWGLGR